jgi:hemolysin activation/secretion protein
MFKEGLGIRRASAGLLLSISFLMASLLPAQAKGVSSQAEAQAWDLDFSSIAQNPGLPPAQDILPPSRQPQPEPSPPTSQPAPLDLPSPTPSPTPDVLPDGTLSTIQVTRFEVVGSTIFSAEELAKVTQPFTNRPLSFSELSQVSTAIAQLYIDRGYITSGAYIPPQRLQGGVVKIQVLEGTLEDIKITGTKRLNNSYVKRRVALGTKAPLNRDRLLEALQLLQLNPLIKNLSAELSAGTRPGENLLEVKVKEAKSFQPTLILDNGRSPSVGSFRRRLSLLEGNLSGNGDRLQADYTNTNGSNSLDLQYTWPLNARNGTLRLGYGFSFSNVIERPFNALDIVSDSNYYELALRQPILQTPKQEVGLGLALTRQSSSASLLNGLIPFPSPGADAQGNTNLWVLKFSQDWTRRSSQDVLALRSEFSIGLDVFDATTQSDAPDGRFFAWRGQGQWVRILAPDTLLLLRTQVQLADRALVPLAQIGLGGIDSVRGYRQDALLTDSGLFASAEARFPIARFRSIDSLLQIVPFAEFGTGWNLSGRPNPDPNYLASLGLGLRWQTSNNLTLRFDVGFPLGPINLSRRSLQEQGFYFSLNYTP